MLAALRPSSLRNLRDRAILLLCFASLKGEARQKSCRS
jgi:hypothetical protein